MTALLEDWLTARHVTEATAEQKPDEHDRMTRRAA
jgi:hypothetical protein